MAKEIIHRIGTTIEHQSFVGAEGEWTHDVDLNTIRVHDGSTVGGFPLAKSGTSETFENLSVQQDLTVNGTITAQQDLTVNGTVAVQQDLTVNGTIDCGSIE